MTRIKSGTDELRQVFDTSILAGLCGLDLGYGGDSIHPCAINMDMAKPYTNVGNDPQHLRGDARRLHWFRSDVLDYVYSSHLLEDFPNTEAILAEWIRVIRPGGMLLLCLPNEQKYRAHCKSRGEGRNMNHSIINMSIEYMTPIIEGLGMTIDEAYDHGYYSFFIKAIK